MSSDPILDALNAAARRATAPAPAMSAPTGDPVLAALQARAAQPDPAPAPSTPPRSFLEQTGDFLQAGAHHLANLPWSINQLMANGAALPFRLAPNNSVSRSMFDLADSVNRTVADREAAYQASVPNSKGAYAGATVGTIGPLFVGGVGGGLQRAGDAVAAKAAPLLPKAVAPLGSRMVSGATQGALVAGATQPVTDDVTNLSDLVSGQPHQGYWSSKLDQVAGSAAFGGVLPVASTGVGAAWNAARRSILSPTGYAGRQVAIQLGPDAAAVANRLDNAPEYVPGSVPTSAQAGEDPRLVMIEKGLANANSKFKADLAARENSNNAARLNVVAGVAKTPAELQAAIDARDAATKPMRDFTVTNGNPVPVGGIDAAMTGVAGGPLGVAPTIGGAVRSMQSDLDGMTTVTPANTMMNTPGSATASPAMLDALRQNSNEYLSKFAPNGAVGTKEQAAMTPIKAAIVDAIDQANPGHKVGTGGWGQGLPQMGPNAPSYRDYLAAFASKSVPVNTMQVGQDVQGPLLARALNSEGEAAVTLPAYRTALAKALRDTDYAIDPQAQAALEGVQSDLQRATISNSIKSPGSDTAYNDGAASTFLKSVGASRDSASKSLLTAGATLALTGSPNSAGVAGLAVKRVGDYFADRTGNALGNLMLDPQRLADALRVGSMPLTQIAPNAFGPLTPTPATAASIRAALVQALLQPQPATVDQP